MVHHLVGTTFECDPSVDLSKAKYTTTRCDDEMSNPEFYEFLKNCDAGKFTITWVLNFLP